MVGLLGRNLERCIESVFAWGLVWDLGGGGLDRRYLVGYVQGIELRAALYEYFVMNVLVFLHFLKARLWDKSVFPIDARTFSFHFWHREENLVVVAVNASFF